MRRIAAAVLCVGMTAPSAALAAGDDPPPLTAPALAGPTTGPEPAPAPTPGPAPTPASPASRRSANAVLVVPGVPSSRSSTRPRPPAINLERPASSAPAPADLPDLIGPAEMPSRGPTLEPVREPGPGDPGRPARPSITLESVPSSGEDRGDHPEPVVPSSRRPVDTKGPVAPRRPQGFFGRIFPGVSEGREGRNAGNGVKIEPRNDPAADAALKRRVERQIRETVGPKLRSVEVRVVGGEVTIQGRASRFWQRRGVRHSLETLPALSGVKATVEVLD